VERYRAYRAPLDSATFSDLPMRLTDHDVTGISAFTMQLQLDTLLVGARFEPFSFSLQYNDAHLSLADITATPKSFLDSIDVYYNLTAWGAEVGIDRPALINGSAVLNFLFHTRIRPQDTVTTAVVISNAVFEAGCYRPVIDSGTVRIRTGTPDMVCDMSGPDALTWLKSGQRYAPQPFAVTMTVENQGDGGATGMRFRLAYDTADVRLVAPAGVDIIPDPRELFPGAQCSAVWQLEARPRAQGDSITLRVTAYFDNAPPVTCTHRVYVPEAERTMQCALDVPAITADQPKLRYDPMPFPVTLTVHNPGRDTLRSVRARIVLPVQLSLAGPDAPDHWVKDVLPGEIAPRESAVQTWLLTHALSKQERTYLVDVWLYADNEDSSSCSAFITIPAIDAPRLSASCVVPDSLRFNLQYDAYEPEQFWVTLKCINAGELSADDVTGTLILPPEMELVSQGDSLTKTFQPSLMEPWQQGQYVPYVRWLIHYADRPHTTTWAEFRFRVTGKSTTGIALDTAWTSCTMRIPPVKTQWNCVLEMPDSLRLHPNGSGVEPNPFSVRYTIANAGTQAGVLRRVQLSLPRLQDVSLHPSSPMGLDDSVDITIGPNSTARFEWILDVRNRITRRDLQLTATAWDEAGDPVSCGGVLPIAAVQRQLTCSGIDVPQSMCGNEGTSLTVRATLRNPGSVTVNAPTVFLEWSEEGTSPLLELDASVPGNVNPQTRTMIFAEQEREYTWQFRLRADHTASPNRPVRFRLRYSGEGVPEQDGGSGCASELQILPRRAVPILLSGPTAFCEGDSVILDAGAGYMQYLWSSGDTLRRITVQQSGMYVVSRRQSIYPHCPVASDTVDITVHPLPGLPMITRSGDTLTASDAADWQWMRDGAPLAGATGRQYIVTVDGSYAVRVHNAFGCTASSDPLQITLTGVNDPPGAGLHFDVFPQPARGRFTVRLAGGAAGPLLLRITDMLGREVSRSRHHCDGSTLAIPLDLSAVPPGAYLLRVEGAGGAQNRIIMLASP
jgi:hypothetical protein